MIIKNIEMTISGEWRLRQERMTDLSNVTDMQDSNLISKQERSQTQLTKFKIQFS